MLFVVALCFVMWLFTFDKNHVEDNNVEWGGMRVDWEEFE